MDLFEEEFDKLLRNVADDNTDADKVREITIKLAVKPNKTREKADTKVTVTSRLAPLKAHESMIVLSSDGKKVSAFTLTPEKQPELGINVREFPAVGGN